MSDDADPAAPCVSVVIPAYRAEGTLGRAIDSVLDQRGVDVRIIVVVDGKFDRSSEVALSYSDPRITVEEHETNRGAAISRNDGLAVATSDFVMFLDADDFLEGPLLHGQVAAIGNSDADVAFGPMQILDERQGRRRPRYVPDFTSSEDIFRKWHLNGIYVNPTSVMWRTEYIRQIAGWDPEITRNDDGELVMRAALLGAKIAVTSEGTGVYVKHSSDSLNNRVDNMESMLRANEKLLAIDSPVISKDAQREVCAGHFFNIAWHCFLNRREELGNVALARSRQLGGQSRGSIVHRLSCHLLGVSRTCQLIRWIKDATGAATGTRGDTRPAGSGPDFVA